MKPILLFLLTPLALNAQLAVKFYGANTNGLPEYWPAIVQPGTNTPQGFVQVDQATLDNIVATNKPAYDAWESNKTAVATATRDAKLADLMDKLDKIALWVDRTKGTNTLTNAQRDNAINDICSTLKKLRSVIRDLYKPENDE